MDYLEHPIQNLANAMASAKYVDLDEVVYQDRDWNKYHQWQKEVYLKLPKHEQTRLLNESRATGTNMEPADCWIEKKRRPFEHEISVVAMFPQMWGSTALGFGGIGGAAMTTAYTIVLQTSSQIAVYFGGRFAYVLRRSEVGQLFYDDIAKDRLASVKNSGQYFTKTAI